MNFEKKIKNIRVDYIFTLIDLSTSTVIIYSFSISPLWFLILRFTTNQLTRS